MLKFRFAKAGDVPALVRLVNSAYRGDSSRQGWTTEADFLDGQRIDAETLAQDIAKPNARVLVAEGPQGIVGSAYLEKRDDSGYIGMVTISPDLQAQGLGRQMLEESERVLQSEWGVKKAQMSVIPLRTELIAWYERRGYHRTGRILPFPAYEDTRFGKPQRPDLTLEILEKKLA